MTVKTKFHKSNGGNLNAGSSPDTLTRYMSKIKPLTRDEECELGHKISKGDIAALQKLVQRNLKYVVSLANKYRGYGEGTTYLELLEKQDAIPCDEQVIRQELNFKISELLMNLPEREKEILRMRFGSDGEAKTLEEIGRKIGVSRERVRQIEKRAKEKLKSKSNSKTSFEPLS